MDKKTIFILIGLLVILLAILSVQTESTVLWSVGLFGFIFVGLIVSFMFRQKKINKNLRKIGYKFEDKNGKWSKARYERALQKYNKAIISDLNNVELRLNKGLILDKLDRDQDALDIYDSIIKINPKYALAYNNKGSVFEKMGDYEKTLKMYDKAISLDKKCKEAYNNKGVIFDKLNRYEEALLMFDTAIKIDNKFKDAYHNRCVVLIKLEKYEDVVNNCNEYMKINKEDGQLYAIMGDALIKLAKYKEALAALNRAIKFGFDNNQIYINKGMLLVMLGGYKEALKIANNVIGKDNYFYRAYYLRSAIYQKMGENSKAVADNSTAKLLKEKLDKESKVNK